MQKSKQQMDCLALHIVILVKLSVCSDSCVNDLQILTNHSSILPLLLLRRFSPVRLCATPQMAAHQAPPSLGFSTGVGCHFLLQCMKVKRESEVSQSCPTLSDPMDCSPPGSSIHGIFQARVLEWGAIASPLPTAVDLKVIPNSFF